MKTKKIFTGIICMSIMLGLLSCGAKPKINNVSESTSSGAFSDNIESSGYFAESGFYESSSSTSGISDNYESSAGVSGSTKNSSNTKSPGSAISSQAVTSNLPDSSPVPTITPASKKSNFVGISPSNSVGIPESEWIAYRELGIKSIRVHLQYGNIGSSVTNPDFSKYDIVVNRAKKEGIEVVMLLSYESYPSVSEPLNLGWGPIMKFTNSIELIPIAKKAIMHFTTLGVKKWEIWNEQNGTWNVDYNSYAQLLTQLYEKCKYTEKWDTTATIAFGGLDAVDVNFTDGVNGAAQNYVKQFYMSTTYANFKAKYGRSPFDAFCIHPYNTIDVSATAGITKNVMAVALQKTIINVMDNNGDVGMPIWITEYGNQDSDEDKNARAVYESILAIYAIPQVEMLHWFKYCYVGSNYSIVFGDGTKRKSYYSFCDAVKLLK